MRPLCLVFCLLLAACHEHAVEVADWVPAQLPLLQGERAAVLDLSGTGGDDVAALVDAELRDVYATRLVARAEAVRLGADESLPVNLGLDEALALGRRLGAATVLFGQMRRNDYKESWERQPHLTCVPRWDQDSRRFEQSCSTTYTYERLGALRAGAWVGVADVDGEALVGQAEVEVVVPRRTRPQRSTWRGTVQPSHDFFAEDVEALRAEAYPQLAGAIGQAMRPRRGSAHVVLYASRRVPQSKAALERARAGDWEAATALYRAGAEAAAARRLGRRAQAYVQYNLGVAQAMGGAWDEGMAALAVARQLHDVPLFAQSQAQLVGRRARAELVARQLAWALPEADG